MKIVFILTVLCLSFNNAKAVEKGNNRVSYKYKSGALSTQKKVAKEEKKQIKKKTSHKKSSAKKQRKKNISSKISNQGFADIIENLLPTVVNISALHQENPQLESNSDRLPSLPRSPLFNDFRKKLKGHDHKKILSIGSGFLISQDGLIVTNNHVIEKVSKITVSTNDGQKYQANIIGVDQKTDLALLKINSNKKFNFAKFGDSNKSRIGDWVIVIGNPYGLGSSVSVGIVSARSRNLENIENDELIQTDAAINKGNSGGPMFNVHGEVIGISSAIFSPSGVSVGIGFATPSKKAQKIINELRKNGEVTRGWIGISIQEVTSDIAEIMKIEKLEGAFINEVIDNSPADKAGLLPSDIIVKFNQQQIKQMNDLPKAVSNYKAGEIALITVTRNGQAKTLRIKVGTLKSGEEIKEKIFASENSFHKRAEILDLIFSEVSSLIQKTSKEKITVQGLIIEEINPKSNIAKQGSLMVGDIIKKANGQAIYKIEDLEKEIKNSQNNNNKLLLLIRRNNSEISTILDLEE